MNDKFLVGKKLPNFNLKTTKRNTLSDTNLIGNTNIIFVYPRYNILYIKCSQQR